MLESVATSASRLRRFAARRRVVWLAGRRSLIGASLGEWLVWLRWIAVAGMTATTLFARRFVPGIALEPILFVLGSIASMNVLWLYLVQRRPEQASSAKLLALQIAVDVGVLGAVLWFTGGVENPFSIFLTFQVALAALLCGGSAGVAIALLAVAVAAGLSWAPPLPWHTATVPERRLERIGQLVALAGVAAFVGVTAYMNRQRLEAMRSESTRNERFVVLGRLLAGMAHELNTPLATIVVASDELVYAGRDSNDPEVERLSTTISQEAKRASNVISLLRGQLRDARIIESIDVGSVVREVVQKEVEAQRFRGQVNLSAPHMQAWGIPTALRQIVGNVVKNAIEAMQDRGDARLDVRCDNLGARIVVRVQDNGCGIRAEHLPHVGEPFLTTKESSGGTGLGLYVSSLLAEQMKAVLQIEGGEGSGTCVTLSLYGVDEEPPSVPTRITHA